LRVENPKSGLAGFNHFSGDLGEDAAWWWIRNTNNFCTVFSGTKKIWHGVGSTKSNLNLSANSVKLFLRNVETHMSGGVGGVTGAIP
jgi:hypothetical protein